MQTIEVPTPVPLDLITPLILCGLIRQAYRLHRLKYRTFQYLYRNHSLEYLVTTIFQHYQSFAENLDLTLSNKDVESHFDALRWSTRLLDEASQMAIASWTRKLKQENRGILDILIFRN